MYAFMVTTGTLHFIQLSFSSIGHSFRETLKKVFFSRSACNPFHFTIQPANYVIYFNKNEIELLKLQ